MCVGAEMGRKAKHHYIPKCYLKEFTNEGKDSSQFWAISKNNDAPFITTPNDSCAVRDYYSIDHENSLIVENFYAEQIEPKICRAIKYIKSYSCLPPKEEMKHLILLLATLYVRVPSNREKLEMPMEATKKIVESMIQEINISNKKEFEYSKTNLIKLELRLLDIVQNYLSNKYYQLHIIEDKNLDVITSDNPFILSHPKGGKNLNFGLNTSNIEICVPITSKAILIAQNEEMKEGSFIATKKLIGLTNRKLILSAKRFFYSKTKEILLVDNSLSQYKNSY